MRYINKEGEWRRIEGDGIESIEMRWTRQERRKMKEKKTV
jgi:hypothetical protein